jgi:hypothetical protein
MSQWYWTVGKIMYILVWWNVHIGLWIRKICGVLLMRFHQGLLIVIGYKVSYKISCLLLDKVVKCCLLIKVKSLVI